MKKKLKKENIILSSLKESFKSAKKRLGLIAFLFLLQLIFLIILFALTVNYSFKIKDKMDLIFGYLEKQDLSGENVEKSVFQGNLLGDDPLIIHRNYTQIIKNITLLSLFALLSYIVINGLLWSFSDSIINKKGIREFFIYFGRFSVVAGVFAGFTGVLLYKTLKSLAGSFMAGNILKFDFASLLLFMLLLYFMYISFALIGKNRLIDIPKKAFFIGIKKAHIILIAYLIGLFFIALFSLSIGLAIELHIAMLIFAVILFVGSLVWARIFLVLVVSKARNQI